MSCAKKLVIVGDPMQLPNVLTAQDEERARQVALKYDVPEFARFERHNLLSAVRAAFPKIPETLLREHYRCHPKIIQFCNQKFYGGELLVMTRDQGERTFLRPILPSRAGMRAVLSISARLMRLFSMFCQNLARSSQPISALFRPIENRPPGCRRLDVRRRSKSIQCISIREEKSAL